MTPEEVALVRDQARGLSGGSELADCFYSHLFAAHPEMIALFPRDMDRQRRRFGAELEALVRGVSHPRDLAPRATSLGRLHQQHGISEAHFEAAGAALLAALSESVPDWDGASAVAWARAFDLMAEAMLDGYA